MPPTSPTPEVPSPLAPGALPPGTAETGPGALDFAGAGAGADFSPAATAGTGGVATGSRGLFPVIGDMPSLRLFRQPSMPSRLGAFQNGAPIQGRQGFPPLPEPLPPQPSPISPISPDSIVPPGAFGAEVRAIKIADNQSPLPQDRVFYTFNYFENFGQVFNQRLGTGVTDMRIYQHLFGFEKTFFDQDASIGFRLPYNSLVIDSMVPGFGGQQNSLGDLSIFVKKILMETTWSNGDAFFLTTGLTVTPPTGPRAFAGFPGVGGFRNTNIQPFLGYVYTRGRFFLHGFSSIDVPVGDGGADVTFLFNDIGIGYFVFNDRSPGRVVTALAPTMEVHVNTPLNHRGFDPRDPASTLDTVNMTFGLNTELFGTSVLTAAYATPVTGPRLFDYEFILQLNFFFGGSRRGGLGGGAGFVPPFAGG